MTEDRQRYGGAQTVTATEAARNFGRLVDTVRESRADIIVERGGVGVMRRAAGGAARSSSSQSGGTDDLGREVEVGRALTNRPEVPRDPWAS
jgi:predicted Rossmann-fold nucleotide-binding protein